MAKYASVLFKSLFAILVKDDNDHHRQGKHDHSQYDQFRLITMAYIRFPTILLSSAETVVLSRSHWPLLQISHFRLIIMMDAVDDDDYKRII